MEIATELLFEENQFEDFENVDSFLFKQITDEIVEKVVLCLEAEILNIDSFDENSNVQTLTENQLDILDLDKPINFEVDCKTSTDLQNTNRQSLDSSNQLTSNLNIFQPLEVEIESNFCYQNPIIDLLSTSEFVKQNNDVLEPQLHPSEELISFSSTEETKLKQNENSELNASLIHNSSSHNSSLETENLMCKVDKVEPFFNQNKIDHQSSSQKSLLLGELIDFDSTKTFNTSHASQFPTCVGAFENKGNKIADFPMDSILSDSFHTKLYSSDTEKLSLSNEADFINMSTTKSAFDPIHLNKTVDSNETNLIQPTNVETINFLDFSLTTFENSVQSQATRDKMDQNVKDVCLLEHGVSNGQIDDHSELIYFETACCTPIDKKFNEIKANCMETVHDVSCEQIFAVRDCSTMKIGCTPSIVQLENENKGKLSVANSPLSHLDDSLIDLDKTQCDLLWPMECLSQPSPPQLMDQTVSNVKYNNEIVDLNISPEPIVKAAIEINSGKSVPKSMNSVLKKQNTGSTVRSLRKIVNKINNENPLPSIEKKRLSNSKSRIPVQIHASTRSPLVSVNRNTPTHLVNPLSVKNKSSSKIPTGGIPSSKLKPPTQLSKKSSLSYKTKVDGKSITKFGFTGSTVGYQSGKSDKLSVIPKSQLLKLSSTRVPTLKRIV